MRRPLALLASCTLAFTFLSATASAITDSWASWTPITGSSNDYATTMQQRSAGFPAAAMASDSRANVQLPSGGSVFLGAGTPPGAKYGSSQGIPYIVLRPRADTPTTPSVTTYTFATPTPDLGWAFVLGDIDADAVRISATDADGNQVPAAEIDTWFKGTFNHAGGSDLPTWEPATSTLTGNAGAVDTNGASGWFEPDVRLTSLTFTFTRRAGFPVYQTWFVSRARPIGGTVDDTSVAGSCPVEDVTLTLLSPYGEELATTSPDASGVYTFGEFATQAGYVVRLDVPETCAVVGPAEAAADNRGNDNDPESRADFEVRAVVPQPISGTVRDDAGDPVPGVEVTLTRPGGGTVTTTTDSDGGYLFDDNDIGTGYTVSVAVPGGYRPGPAGTEIDGIAVVATPVTDQHFVVVVLPSISGTVTGGGNGLGGIQVVLTPETGTTITTVTRGDGSYDLTGVPPGDYTLSVNPPPGYTAPPARPLTVAESDLVGQDFALSRPGALGGAVTGTQIAGVEVVVDGPGGPRTLSTDAEGQYFLDGLPAGTYTITVTPPDGTTVGGPSTRTVTTTAAGEIRGGQDFALVAAPAPSPTPTPTPTPTPSPSPSPTTSPSPGSPSVSPSDSPSPEPTGTPTAGEPPTGDRGRGGDDLPDTGGPELALAGLGGTLLLGGLLLLTRSHRRTRLQDV